MADQFNIARFIEAQDSFGSYPSALQEVIDGNKQTHWIWYVFPQMRGLGYSGMSRFYGISSIAEAKAYLENECLGKRLREVTQAMYAHRGSLSAEEIFGKTDARKVCSCMTLFDLISPGDIFNDVLSEFYAGNRCPRTMELVRKGLP